MNNRLIASIAIVAVVAGVLIYLLSIDGIGFSNPLINDPVESRETSTASSSLPVDNASNIVVENETSGQNTTD